ncbi:MAG TPA: ABC transporter permease subunit [Desulfotomaculum sp.]|nr:ABC transporter permease subunit [Desulfotomaculum sp.]
MNRELRTSNLVVYGFFGLAVLVPFIMNAFGGWGLSLLGGAILLAVMVLPTMIGISEDAIRAVPPAYKEAALALGATHWQVVRKILLPAARSGIVAAVVLSLGRAIGETMVVIMVTGNVVAIPDSILDPLRTLTANVALEMAYAFGDPTQALCPFALCGCPTAARKHPAENLVWCPLNSANLLTLGC